MYHIQAGTPVDHLDLWVVVGEFVIVVLVDVEGAADAAVVVAVDDVAAAGDDVGAVVVIVADEIVDVDAVAAVVDVVAAVVGIALWIPLYRIYSLNVAVTDSVHSDFVNAMTEPVFVSVSYACHISFVPALMDPDEVQSPD